MTPGAVPTPRLFVSTSPWQHLGHRCCCHGNRWTGGLAITSFSPPSPPAQHRGQSAPPIHTHTHTHDPSHGSHTYLDTHCVLSQLGQTCYSPQSPWIRPLSGPVPKQTCLSADPSAQQTCPLSGGPGSGPDRAVNTRPRLVLAHAWTGCSCWRKADKRPPPPCPLCPTSGVSGSGPLEQHLL